MWVFIEGSLEISLKSKPLTKLLQKGVSFYFDDKCLFSFDKLKYALSHAPIIKPPVWDMNFDLICEANDDAVGVTLGQHIGRRFNIIHHASRTLNSAQKNYPKEERESSLLCFSPVINFVLILLMQKLEFTRIVMV